MGNRTSAKGKTATILSVGNELLSGDVVDTNSAWLAKKLSAQGVLVEKMMVVGDDVEAISAALKSSNSEFVFVMGGLGPTHDDITRYGVAKGVGKALERNETAASVLTAMYGLNDSLLRMADFPIGSEVISNQVGAAPGFRVDNVIVLPGVPEEMKAMFEAIASSFRVENAIRAEEWVLTDKPEDEILDALNEAVKIFTDVNIGSYPYLYGKGDEKGYKSRIKLLATDLDALKRAKEWLEERIC